MLYTDTFILNQAYNEKTILSRDPDEYFVTATPAVIERLWATGRTSIHTVIENTTYHIVRL